MPVTYTQWNMNDSTPLCTCTRTRTPPRRSLASSTLCFYIAQHQHTVATRRPLAARPALHPSLSLCLSVCASLSNEGTNLTTQTQRPLLVAQADVRAVFKPFALLVHDLHCAQACAYMHMPHALRSMHTCTQAPAAVCSRSVPHANAACYTYSHHAVGPRAFG